jgi:hypothetical protein
VRWGQLKGALAVNEIDLTQPQLENRMDQPKQPSKEAVRAWLRAELVQHRPPPDPKQIRRELGWDLARPDLALANSHKR